MAGFESGWLGSDRAGWVQRPSSTRLAGPSSKSKHAIGNLIGPMLWAVTASYALHTGLSRLSAEFHQPCVTGVHKIV
jgi:hypothetical protein